MRQLRIDDRLLWCGAVGGPLFVVVALIEGATRPGYNPWTLYVSQLATSDQGWMQIANFIITGALLAMWSLALASHFKSTVGPRLITLFSLSLIVAGVFVTDPAMGYPPGTTGSGPQTWHGLIHGLNAPLCFGLLTAAAVVMGRYFLRNRQLRWGVGSLLVALVIVCSFVSSTVSSVLSETGAWPDAPTGVFQRVGIAVGWGWISLLALSTLQGSRSQLRAGARPSARGDLNYDAVDFALDAR